jgi:hypothetical protein
MKTPRRFDMRRYSVFSDECITLRAIKVQDENIAHSTAHYTPRGWDELAFPIRNLACVSGRSLEIPPLYERELIYVTGNDAETRIKQVSVG